MVDVLPAEWALAQLGYALLMELLVAAGDRMETK